MQQCSCHSAENVWFVFKLLINREEPWIVPRQRKTGMVGRMFTVKILHCKFIGKNLRVHLSG